MSVEELPPALAGALSVACTLEMLQVLRGLAVAHGHDALAQLLAASAAEARALMLETKALQPD